VPPTAILGIGHALPSRLVTNEELAGPLGVDATALAARTGITQRYYADAGVGPAALALEASPTAFTRAGLGVADVDFLIFATMTPDVAFPGSGCVFQHVLEAPTIGALDLRAQCLGFVFSLLAADRYLQAGTYARVLVAAGEVHSTALDFSPRGARVTPYFGDGAAVAILGRADDGRGLVAGVMHTDAAAYERFWCEYPAGRQYPVRMTLENLRAGRHYYQIAFDELNPFAVATLGAVVTEVLARGGCRREAVAHFFLHYVDPRVALQAAGEMGIPPERVTATAARAGHIGGASLPIALSQAWGAGVVRAGDLVCLAAVGAGINWGAALIRL
jgi:3-oxoacyl-[acyl-carrier-protein] synthase-3